MAKILRGGIYWCRLDPSEGREQRGTRPVLVVSHDVFNNSSQTVIGLAITSQEPKAPFPLTYKLKELLVDKQAWVKISQIRVLSIDRLQNKIGDISNNELGEVVLGLNKIVA